LAVLSLLVCRAIIFAMMAKNADVIVVGAGPAGSMLAYHLARAGVKVLLIEKARLPRYKPCGGGLTWRALKNLPADPTPVIASRALGGMLGMGGRIWLRDEISPFAVALVMRDQFDSWLAEQAANAGAQLWDQTPVLRVEESAEEVSVETPRTTLRAAYLVGADGVNSIVARNLGLLPKRPTGVALEAELDVAPGLLGEQSAYITFDFGILPHGYGWIFPKADRLSVGVFRAKSGSYPGLRDALWALLAAYPALQQGHISLIQGYRIPLGGGNDSLHTRRALLIGDAANLADPFLGEGISFALQSAGIACQVLLHSLQGGYKDLGAYTHHVDREIRRELRSAARLGAWVYGNPWRAATLLRRSQRLRRLWLDALADRLPYRTLLIQLAVYLPQILAQALGRRDSQG